MPKLFASFLYFCLAVTPGEVMSIMQTKEQFLDVGYAELYCQTWFTQETENKTPIIFVHGGPGLESGYIINIPF